MNTDMDRLKRVAVALGEVRLYDKHNTGEFVTMRLRDSLGDHPGFDARAVDAKLLELAQAALDAAG